MSGGAPTPATALRSGAGDTHATCVRRIIVGTALTHQLNMPSEPTVRTVPLVPTDCPTATLILGQGANLALRAEGRGELGDAVEVGLLAGGEVPRAGGRVQRRQVAVVDEFRRAEECHLRIGSDIPRRRCRRGFGSTGSALATGQLDDLGLISEGRRGVGIAAGAEPENDYYGGKCETS